MPIDLSKLTPAPWEWSEDDPGWGGLARSFLNGPRSAVVLSGVGEHADGTICIENATDAEFITLARNAFDVMLRRGWNPSKSPLGEGWRVDMDNGEWFSPTMPDGYIDAERFNAGHNIWHAPDPFTALVAADEWYKQNVEAAPERTK